MSFRVLKKKPPFRPAPYDPDNHEQYMCAGHLPDPKKYDADTILRCSGCGSYWRRGNVYAPWGPEQKRDGQPEWYTCPDGIDESRYDV